MFKLEHQKKKDHCHGCFSKFPTELFLCGRCDQVFYCSQECQKKLWPTHKLLCRSHESRDREIDFSNILDALKNKNYIIPPICTRKIVKKKNDKYGDYLVFLSEEETEVGELSKNFDQTTSDNIENLNSFRRIYAMMMGDVNINITMALFTWMNYFNFDLTIGGKRIVDLEIRKSKSKHPLWHIVTNWENKDKEEWKIDYQKRNHFWVRMKTEGWEENVQENSFIFDCSLPQFLNDDFSGGVVRVNFGMRSELEDEFPIYKKSVLFHKREYFLRRYNNLVEILGDKFGFRRNQIDEKFRIDFFDFVECFSEINGGRIDALQNLK